MPTTHFALARELRHIAPDQQGDTRRLMVADTADILEAQDRRIEEMTVVLREVRTTLRQLVGDARGLGGLTDHTLDLVNACLNTKKEK